MSLGRKVLVGWNVPSSSLCVVIWPGCRSQDDTLALNGENDWLWWAVTSQAQLGWLECHPGTHPCGEGLDQKDSITTCACPGRLQTPNCKVQSIDCR